MSLEEINRLRAEGLSFRRIGQALGIGASTALHLWRDGTTPGKRRKPVQKLHHEELTGNQGIDKSIGAMGEGFIGREKGGSSRTRRTRLTQRELKMVKALTTANSIAEAGRMAGYSEVTMNKSSWYRKVHEKIRPLTLAHLARQGMTLPNVAKRHAQLLDADKGLSLGKGVVEMVPDNDARLKATEMYYRLLGPLGKLASDLPGDEELGGTRVTVNVNVPAVMGHATGEKEVIQIEIDPEDDN